MIYNILSKVINLSIKAGVCKSKEKACYQCNDFTWRIQQTHLVSLLVIVGVTREVDDHEGVGQDADDAAQEHHRVTAVPEGELHTKEPE